jgi:hypothetical protein
MPLLKRFLAAAALLVLGVTEMAPHRHADRLDVWSDADGATRPAHIVRCDGPAAGATHMHRDVPQSSDACLACFRQHMRATASRVVLGAPQPLQHFIAVAARVAYAHAIRLRKSSRAPPALAS